MAELVYFNQQSVDKQNNFYILYSERFLFFTLSVGTKIWNPLKKGQLRGKKLIGTGFNEFELGLETFIQGLSVSRL